MSQWPYPKEVWSPSGGWWVQPRNWKSNTLVASAGLGLLVYGVWQYSADREWRHTPPTRPIPSMKWSRQFLSGEMGVNWSREAREGGKTRQDDEGSSHSDAFDASKINPAAMGR